MIKRKSRAVKELESSLVDMLKKNIISQRQSLLGPKDKITAKELRNKSEVEMIMLAKLAKIPHTIKLKKKQK